jgi:hypothetical protein
MFASIAASNASFEAQPHNQAQEEIYEYGDWSH